MRNDKSEMYLVSIASSSSQSDLFFREAIDAHIDAYSRQFGDRLCAVYVWGSVHRGEAVVGVSDLDLHAFVTGELAPSDEIWFKRERDTLELAFPSSKGLSRPRPLLRLYRGTYAESTDSEKMVSRALSFRLSFDATLVWGKDVLPGLAALNCFDRNLALGSFASARDVLRWAVGWNETNDTDFSLPDDSALRLRKIARLAVVSGAWFLVASRQSGTLRGAKVLPILRDAFPNWSSFLGDTELLYVNPIDTEHAINRLEAYALQAAGWSEMLFEMLQKL